MGETQGMRRGFEEVGKKEKDKGRDIRRVR